MIGSRFTRLTVVAQTGKAKWLCKCDCGNEKVCYTCQLKDGNNKSCGCLKRDMTVARNTTHGLSKRPEYSNWKDMNKRCFNPNNKRYTDYAGRGISVHADFVESFPKWFEEIGPKPQDGERWSVGRIDNDGWYTYDNLEWQLDDEQARNHSLQKNNTTGFVGISKRTRTIAGNGYTSYKATFKGLDGKNKAKEFSSDKFGDAEALAMAVAWRAKELKELEKYGIIYAPSHGSSKIKEAHG